MIVFLYDINLNKNSNVCSICQPPMNRDLKGKVLDDVVCFFKFIFSNFFLNNKFFQSRFFREFFKIIFFKILNFST